MVGPGIEPGTIGSWVRRPTDGAMRPGQLLRKEFPVSVGSILEGFRPPGEQEVVFL